MMLWSCNVYLCSLFSLTNQKKMLKFLRILKITISSYLLHSAPLHRLAARHQIGHGLARLPPQVLAVIHGQVRHLVRGAVLHRSWRFHVTTARGVRVRDARLLVALRKSNVCECRSSSSSSFSPNSQNETSRTLLNFFEVKQSCTNRPNPHNRLIKACVVGRH